MKNAFQRNMHFILATLLFSTFLRVSQ